jgi:hypothetical protein
MISMSFDRPERTARRASEARKRYGMRFTRSGSVRIFPVQQPRPSIGHPQASVLVGSPGFEHGDYARVEEDLVASTALAVLVDDDLVIDRDDIPDELGGSLVEVDVVPPISDPRASVAS